MFRQLLAPISVQWELTSICNYNCVHCYNYWRDKAVSDSNLQNVQDFFLAELIVNQIIQNNVFQVTLTGGEPLVVLQKYFPILLKLHDSGVGININTNLSLLDDNHILMLKEIGVKSILTSLMSFDEEMHDFISDTPGAFKKSCDGIRKAVDSGFRVAVNMVVSKKNLEHVIKTGQLVKRLGASVFCATKASKPLSCVDFGEYQLSIEDLKKNVY